MMELILIVLQDIFDKKTLDYQTLALIKMHGIKLRTYTKNDRILTLNQKVDFISVIMSGDFYVFKYTQSGELNIVGIKQAPAILGMFGLTKSSEINSGVIALSICQVLQIPIKLFKQAIIENPDLSFFVIDHMTEMLINDVHRMDKYYVSDPSIRLLYYLHERWNNYITNKLVLKEPKYLIASYLGISERTLFRSIKYLKEKKLLDTDNKSIIVTKDQMNKIKKLI